MNKIVDNTIKVISDSKNEIYDISKLYEKIMFNGLNFINIHTGEKICECKIKEFGFIFEIGRIISKKNISFIDYKMKKIL